MKTAIVFLTNNPYNETLDFASEVYRKSKFDVFVVIDDEKQFNTIFDTCVKTIEISDYECQIAGYHSSATTNTTHIQKNPNAWDKALYYFCELNKEYDFVWMLEEDVFVPSVAILNHLHAKYSMNDLVVPNNTFKSDSAMDWHWPSIVNKIAPPYYYSMVCACGMSRRMLESIKQYSNTRNELFYHEVMFNTLAMQCGYDVADPIELKSIVWMGEWGIDEYLLLQNNLFHPKKEIKEHPLYRSKISTAIKEGYKPKNKLPDFIKKLM